MPNGTKQAFYGDPVKIYDSSKGLWTVDPEEFLPDGATPFCANVWYDEHGALSKMSGTELLLTEANNEFTTNLPYNLFVADINGEKILIWQGPNSDGTIMKLWLLRPQTSYPANVAMTDITPSRGLALNRKCYFTNYRNILYLTNGTDTMKSWNGNTWSNYHVNRAERFKYCTVYDDCLIIGCSLQNPSRIAYTGQNEPHLYNYYGGKGYWRDMSFPDGDQVVGMKPSPHGSLLVFGRNNIDEIFGSFVNGTDERKRISANVGTIDISSVQCLGDMVIFAWEDGFYAWGHRRIKMSPQAQLAETTANVQPISRHIRNWWDTHVVVPESEKIKEKVWAGYKDFCRQLGFDAGSTEIKKNDTIAGASSSTTALVVAVDVDSGTWSGGDAAGTLYITTMSAAPESFTDDENLQVGGVTYAVANGTDSGWDNTCSGGYYTARVNIASVTENQDVYNFNTEGSQNWAVINIILSVLQ